MLPGDAPSVLLSGHRGHLLPYGNRAWLRTRLRGPPPDHRATLASTRVVSFFRSPEISTDLAAAAGLATEAIQQTIDTYPGRTTLSCSFGGPSGMVLLDLALAVEPRLTVFCIDTELLFPETYALVRRVEARYRIPSTWCGRSRPSPSRMQPTAMRSGPRPRSLLRPAEGRTAARLPRGPSTLGYRGAARSDRLAGQLRSIDWDEGRWRSSNSLRWPIGPKRIIYGPTFGNMRARSTRCISTATPASAALNAPAGRRPAIRAAGRWPGFEKTECGIHVLDAARDGVTRTSE